MPESDPEYARLGRHFPWAKYAPASMVDCVGLVNASLAADFDHETALFVRYMESRPECMPVLARRKNEPPTNEGLPPV